MNGTAPLIQVVLAQESIPLANWTANIGWQEICLVLTSFAALRLSVRLYKLEHARSSAEDFRFWYERRYKLFIDTIHVLSIMQTKQRIKDMHLLEYLNLSIEAKISYGSKSPQYEAIEHVIKTLQSYYTCSQIIDSYQAMQFMNEKISLNDFSITRNQFKESIILDNVDSKWIYGLRQDVSKEEHDEAMRFFISFSEWSKENMEHIQSIILAPLLTREQ